MKKITNIYRLSIVLMFCLVACNRQNTAVTNVNPTTDSSPTPASVSSPLTEPIIDQNNILFILDASGSMKAKTGSKTKMDAAKEVITELISDLPSTIHAGLMAYGHRRKDDCEDVELLIPVGPIQKDAFAQKVQALQPLGQTPISFSIRQAADVLKGVAGKKAIILISDGEETCKKDPCAVAAELKKADIDLKVHVVGFGLDTAAAKKQLHCIAEATGGTYAEAGNAEELKKKIAEAAAAETEGGDTGKLVSVIQDMDGGQIKYGISFYKPGGTDSDEPLNSTMNLGMQLIDSVHELNIPPGIYDIRYSTLSYPTLWKRNVEIKAGQETRVEFEKFGRIRISVKDQNGQAVNMWTEIHDGTPEEKDLTSDHRFNERLDLPAGTYDLKFWGGGAPETWQKGIVVRSGQETPVNLKVVVSN
jgi:hypothetical protein